MNFLFLDLSTKSTGYAISDENGKLITYGLIIATSSNNVSRIQKIQKEITELIRQYNIEKIIAEDVHPEAYGYSDTARLLMWLQGSIVLGAHSINNNINSKSIEFMQASEWRKQLGIKTGRGVKRENLKPLDIKYVKDNYGIEANDDVCDAICLYAAYFKANQEELNWE